MTLLAACAPPGGGRSAINDRLLRHFRYASGTFRVFCALLLLTFAPKFVANSDCFVQNRQRIHLPINCGGTEFAGQQLTFASVSKRVHMRSLSYVNYFYSQVHSNANQTHFHMKGFALGLVLKQRQKATWK